MSCILKTSKNWWPVGLVFYVTVFVGMFISLWKLSHATYGDEKTSFLQIYRAIIQLKCDYGAVIYTPQPLRLFAKTLYPIHNIANRLSLGIFPTTACHVLYNLSATLTPDLHQKLVFLRFAVRILTSQRTLCVVFQNWKRN